MKGQTLMSMIFTALMLLDVSKGLRNTRIIRNRDACTIWKEPAYKSSIIINKNRKCCTRPSALVRSYCGPLLFQALPSFELQNQQLAHEYVNYIHNFVEINELVSFTINGPSKNKFKIPSEARGYVRMIKGRPIILNSEVVMQVTFKYHSATDICKNWNLKDCYMNLESIMFSTTQEQAIVPHSEWGCPPSMALGTDSGIQSASLEMKNGTKLDLKINRGMVSLQIAATSSKNSTTSRVQSQQHDRNKFTFINVSNPIWRELGVIAPKSETVKPGMSSKLRQCQKFVEIVDRLIRECIDLDASEQKLNVSVVDMGCGRGYLTFALHSYLYNNNLIHVTSRGIDVRPKLIQEISAIASTVGGEFESLRFEIGTIEDFLSEPRLDKAGHQVEVVIALHACDTATDDALWSGICRESDIIVVAPCCHQQLRPQVNEHIRRDNKCEHPYAEILRHNVYRERVAETVTDSMRALLLELSGYKVQVFEFIGGEHTSKNVMITAIKKAKIDPTSPTYKRKLEGLHSVAKLHGIKHQKLSSSLGIVLPEADTIPSVGSMRVNQWKMPPLG